MTSSGRKRKQGATNKGNSVPPPRKKQAKEEQDSSPRLSQLVTESSSASISQDVKIYDDYNYNVVMDGDEDKDSPATTKSTSSVKRSPPLKQEKERKGDDESEEDGDLRDDEREDDLVSSGKSEVNLETKVKSKESNKKRQVTKRKSQIVYKGMKSEKQESTKKVLEDTKAKRLRIVQFGGATGSTAGDAALISLYKSRRRMVIDIGKQQGQWGRLTKALKDQRDNDPANSGESQAETASEDEGSTKTIPITSSSVKGDDADEEEAGHASIDPDDNNLTAMVKPSKQLLLITHWHNDHAGPTTKKQNLWDPNQDNIATYLRDLGAEKNKQLPTLVYGQREPTQKYAALANKMSRRQVVRNPDLQNDEELLFAWKTTSGKKKSEKAQTPSGELRIEGHAILPPNIPELHDKAQNTESLGVLTIVERNSGPDSKERLFTMFSLGDMEAEPAHEDNDVAQAVKNIQAAYCPGIPVDVVKISHHGSDTNLHVVPQGLITAETTVIISGYTGKATKSLIEEVGKWKPKNLIILFQDQNQVDKLKGADWDNLTGPTRDIKTNLILANALVVTVSDNGAVEIEATKL